MVCIRLKKRKRESPLERSISVHNWGGRFSSWMGNVFPLLAAPGRRTVRFCRHWMISRIRVCTEDLEHEKSQDIALTLPVVLRNSTYSSTRITGMWSGFGGASEPAGGAERTRAGSIQLGRVGEEAIRAACGHMNRTEKDGRMWKRRHTGRCARKGQGESL